MGTRLTMEPETQALLKAVRARIDALAGITTEKRTGFDVFLRGSDVFLQIEVRRDHISLDLWLNTEHLEDARASGIARSHPFLGDDALKIRFERAADLARVARWIEESHAYAPRRDEVQKERAERVAREAELKAQREREQREAPPPAASVPPPPPSPPPRHPTVAPEPVPSSKPRRSPAKKAKRTPTPASPKVRAAAKGGSGSPAGRNGAKSRSGRRR